VNDKERVIASMRWYIKIGGRPDSITIAAWMNSLEQAEQQTPPMADGQPCAGESSVQPAATARLIECAERVIKRHDAGDLAGRGDSASIDHMREAIQAIRKATQIEHEAKDHAAG